MILHFFTSCFQKRCICCPFAMAVGSASQCSLILLSPSVWDRISDVGLSAGGGGGAFSSSEPSHCLAGISKLSEESGSSCVQLSFRGTQELSVTGNDCAPVYVYILQNKTEGSLSVSCT